MYEYGYWNKWQWQLSLKQNNTRYKCRSFVFKDSNWIRSKTKQKQNSILHGVDKIYRRRNLYINQKFTCFPWIISMSRSPLTVVYCSASGTSVDACDKWGDFIYSELIAVSQLSGHIQGAQFMYDGSTFMGLLASAKGNKTQQDIRHNDSHEFIVDNCVWVHLNSRKVSLFCHGL